MARSSEPARQAIIASAERLFAEQGIEGPTLREIGAAAGQRNNSAVQYHFGGRDGLLAAVLEPHLEELDARRRVMLDEIDAGVHGPPTVDALVDILVLPLAAKLTTESGVRYLRIQAALLSSGEESPHESARAWRRPVMSEVIERIAGSLEPLDTAESEARHLLVLTLVFNGLANRSAMAVGPPADVLVRTLSEVVRSLLLMPPLSVGGPASAMPSS